MPGLLTHSPADILRQLLVDRGLGVAHNAVGDWPVFTHFEPTTPDNCISTFDTVGARHGRLMQSGQTQLHHGLLVRVRGATSPVAYAKINSITIDMESVYDQDVTIGGTTYSVHSVNHASGPVAIGREEGTDRTLFTVNFLAFIKQQ